MEKNMFDIIKKQNGERFAKAIRNYDNGIFDIPNLDKIVKYAGRAAEPIMQYLVSLKGVKIEEHGVHQDPITLLEQAGYNAYVADTLEKQNAIKKYYANGEELCTFKDDERFEKYYIINAVRKDVDKIKRSDFKNPQREDKYGTSVLSIQILKTGGFISIKNRYNHTVPNPDNTLNSNPDNIIPGLSSALKHYFDVDFSSQNIALPSGYVSIKNQICKYQTEINNVYVGDSFYVKDGVVTELDRREEMMLGGGFVLNLKEKKVVDIAPSADGLADVRMNYAKSLTNIIKGKKIQVTKNPIGGYDILADNKQILTVENGVLVNINCPELDIVYYYALGKMRGSVDISGVKNTLVLSGLDLTAIDSFNMSDKLKGIDLSNTKMPAIDLDLSAVERVVWHGADFSLLTSLKLPKKTKQYYFANMNFPATDIDFSYATDVLSITESDVSRITSFKLPAQINTVNLRNAKVPATDMDFSCVTDTLSINGTDLQHVKSLKLPKNIPHLHLSHTVLPAIDLDLSSVKERLDLVGTDLRSVKSLKLPCSANKINLSYADLPAIDLDLSEMADKFDLHGADLRAITSLKLPSKIKNLDLSCVKFPAIDLDLSNVSGKLNLSGTDFSNVKSLKLPSHITKSDLRYAKMPKQTNQIKTSFLHGTQRLISKIKTFFNAKSEEQKKQENEIKKSIEQGDKTWNTR